MAELPIEQSGDKSLPKEPKTQADFFLRAAEKVRAKFPQSPGVYLFQDQSGRVLYVGKAKSLRSRAGSYFLKAAAEDQRTRKLVREIYDVDFMEAESEVDALLMESRLIKDIQPPFNKELRDDKSFPYLQITTHEDFPRIEVTREPRTSGVKLYGPFTSAGSLNGAIQVLQRVFQFRTCSLDIDAEDERWRWFRPCLLASIKQCTAPCNLRISKDEYRKDIGRLKKFLEGKRKPLLKEMKKEMLEAATAKRFEQAARLRDEIAMLESLHERGDLDKHVQPEVFYIDPQKGLVGLQKVLKLKAVPRTIEGMDIAHLGGDETVASLVQFIDGMPFKPGYRRYRIREVEGIDDYASMQEIVSRRFAKLRDDTELFPDLLLIDGGKGQLNSVLKAFASLSIEPPQIISLAKKEELIFVPGRETPLRLTRHSFALRLLQYIRDEAHRFAQHYHHLLRRKKTFDLE
ncbi:excinuclease ABC subunit UvrC [Bythopirellula polymerisocia]|nr:excinuclease ABC subunit UvrC [Bythopirellula polymerisocia]